MPASHALEELDDATRAYVLAVRDRRGKGLPGVYVPGTNPLPVVLVIVGPILFALTLGLTLGTSQILSDPDNNALVQAAGLTLGAWMTVAAFRAWAGARSPRTAGHWTYGDPLFVYEANAERVTLTPMAAVADVTATHNTNSGTYVNTAVQVKFADGRKAAFTLTGKQPAERFVTFYNYLAWARGPGGGKRAALPPADLAGLANHAAENDEEPLDPDGDPDFSAIARGDLDVPENPTRVGGAGWNVLPYLAAILFALGSFHLMRAVDVPLRDDKVFEMVTSAPVHPMLLRLYLADPRNTAHRDDVYRRLGPFYDAAVTHTKVAAGDPQLGAGMARLLDSLRRADQPLVTVRVREAAPPEGRRAGDVLRAEAVRTKLLGAITRKLTAVTPPVFTPRDVTFEVPPPPLGEQLVLFAESPDGVAPHLDIEYAYEPAKAGGFDLKATVTVRLAPDAGPDAAGVVRAEINAEPDAPGMGAAVSRLVFEALVGEGLGR